MPDEPQLDLERHGDWWYALIGAAPRPENDELVNVGVILGNGRPTHLGFVETLPRLTGIVSQNEISVYKAVLTAAAESVADGRTLESLSAMIGPQLRVMRRRPLYKAPSDDMLDRLKSRFLKAYAQEEGREIDALIERSNVHLDQVLKNARPKHVSIQQDVKLRAMYEGKIDKEVHFRVPKLARAMRSMNRDLIIDSIYVDDGFDRPAVRQATARISEAFYAWEKLRPTIERASGRRVRLLGVLHASTRERNADTKEMRDFVKHMWTADANVIDADDVDELQAMKEQAEWLVEAQ